MTEADYQDQKLHYAVVNIATGKPAYEGISLTVAAEKLFPGTCYGTGDSAESAMNDAMQHAARFRGLPPVAKLEVAL